MCVFKLTENFAESMNMILVVSITIITFVILIMNGKHTVKQKNEEKLATIS